MNLSEINIKLINGTAGHIGFCQFVLNGQLKFNNVGIHTKKDGSGIRLLYPQINGLQSIYPVSKELGSFITAEIEKVLVAECGNCEGVNNYARRLD